MNPCAEHLETAGGPLSSAAVTNAHHRFVYNGYLCVQRLDAANNNDVNLLVVWDPTEPVATRPLFMMQPGGHAFFCTHDGNKNVSEVFFFQQAYGIAAHYEYAPFGVVTAATRNTSVTSVDTRTFNPFRFSSEYADDALGLVYYNYRHYNPADGRWINRDLVEDLVYELNLHSRGLMSENLYCAVNNRSLCVVDGLGLTDVISDQEFPGAHQVGNKWWRYINDGQNGTVSLERKPIFEIEKELRCFARRLCKYEKVDGKRTRKYEREFDTVNFYHGIGVQHQYYYLEYMDDIWADNEINYIGIGMYEAWLGNGLFMARELTWGWKIWKYNALLNWYALPTAGTFFWLTYGHSRFHDLYERLDPCTCDFPPTDGKVSVPSEDWCNGRDK